MRHRKKNIVTIMISIFFLIIVLNYDKLVASINNKVMRVSVTAEEFQLTDDISLHEENIGVISYNGAPVAYDRESRTIYIPQRIDEDGWQGYLKSSGGELFFAESNYWQNKEEAIKTGEKFELYLKKEDVVLAYQVVFTGMPIMCISSTGESVEEGRREIFQGGVQVYDPYHSAAQYQKAECTYNVRGGSSFYYPKSNYKVELTEEKLSFLGMRKDDDWMLNSLYDDAGLIHNKISTEVWRDMAAYNDVKNDDGMDMEYLELFVDNEYQGVYTLTERVDEKELTLGKKDILYKCRAYRIPKEHNYTNEDTDGMRPVFILKYPNEITEEDWEPIKQWVNFYCEGQLPDYEAGAAFLDMENAIDYNIFCLLVNGTDNMRKNIFFVAEYQANGDYQFKKVPWDLNATWGNPWVDIEECNYTMYDPDSAYSVQAWCTDISTLYYYNELEVSKDLYDRWKELRQNGVLSQEKMCQMLDEQFTYLYATGAYERNYERWPEGTEFWDDSYIYEYVENRIAFLDLYFEQLYVGNTTPAIYDGVDYTSEFEVRFYWESNYEVLSEIYDYDREALLEHYVWYGRPYGMIACKTEENVYPVYLYE